MATPIEMAESAMLNTGLKTQNNRHPKKESILVGSP